MHDIRVRVTVKPARAAAASYWLGVGRHGLGGAQIPMDGAPADEPVAWLHVTGEGLAIEAADGPLEVRLEDAVVRGRVPVRSGQPFHVGDWKVSAELIAVDDPAPGRRVGEGRFLLIEELGRGGMGVVWLAVDEELGEEVALKRLPPGLAGDAAALEFLKREVSKSRQLAHPGIVRIHDLVQSSGEAPFVTLEVVAGEDLAVRRGAQPEGFFRWEMLRSWMIQLAAALEHAHAGRVIHRDVKPANLLITADGDLKLADFGVAATLVDTASRSSAPGPGAGTTPYMSPQQLRGHAPAPADDIYSFGATLFELLAGRPPFHQGDIAHQVLNEAPPPLAHRLRELDNPVPEHVVRLAMDCLSKNPADRPADLRGIRRQLDSDGQVLAPRAGQRRRRLAWAAVLVLGLVLAGATLGRDDEGNAVPEISPPPKPVAEAAPHIQPKQPAAVPAQPGEVLQRWDAGADIEAAPVVSPGGVVFIATRQGRLWAWDVRTGEQKWVYGSSHVALSSPALSAKHGLVYTARQNGLVVALNQDTGKVAWERSLLPGIVPIRTDSGVVVDGDTLYVATTPGRMNALDARTGAVLWQRKMPGLPKCIPAVGEGAVYQVSQWHVLAMSKADGEILWEKKPHMPHIGPAIIDDATGRLHTALMDGTIEARNPTTGEVIWQIKLPWAHTSPLAMAGGGLLLVGQHRGPDSDGPFHLFALDGATGDFRWKANFPGQLAGAPVVDSDNKVYFGTRTTPKHIIALSGKDGRLLWKIDAPGAVRASPALGPGGRLMVSCTEGVVLAVQTGDPNPARAIWPCFGGAPTRVLRAPADIKLPEK